MRELLAQRTNWRFKFFSSPEEVMYRERGASKRKNFNKVQLT